MKPIAITAASLGLWAGASLAGELEERGAYLVQGPMACGNCHTPFGPEGPDMSRDLAGRLVEDNDHFKAYAPNITPGGPVAVWSDAELGRAIREGVRPDGSLVGPPMPFLQYRDISDRDLAAVVAYLRTRPAVANEVPASEYHIPLPPAYGPPVNHVADIPPGVTVEYGAYLANAVAHCMECHTPMGPQGPEFDTALGAGGFAFSGPWGVSTSPNLTSHKDGIAAYSDDDLVRMITEGVRPDGTRMLPPMGYGYYANMAPEDVQAIILYLRSLPPLPDPA